jgi:hypothetical protein
MNLETFASASQNELVGWASDLADTFADGELEIKDEASISNEELIYALAVYKLLDNKNLFVKNSAFFHFAREAEAELRRRYTK